MYIRDYVDCMNKLDETSLPPKEALYSKLTGEGTTDEDYQHALTVWKEFDIESMKDYHNLYNLSDVLLLADAFENLRNICTIQFAFDPAWYYSAPRLAWDAALKITKIKLKLLSDPDMIANNLKRHQRRYRSTINCHAKANNDYMGSEFDHTKDSKFISYLYANNLYGWTM